MTNKKGNQCFDVSDVTMCGRNMQMFEWKALWRRGRERKWEGLVCHKYYKSLFHPGCEGFMVCLDGVQELKQREGSRRQRIFFLFFCDGVKTKPEFTEDPEKKMKSTMWICFLIIFLSKSWSKTTGLNIKLLFHLFFFYLYYIFSCLFFLDKVYITFFVYSFRITCENLYFPVF